MSDAGGKVSNPFLQDPMMAVRRRSMLMMHKKRQSRRTRLLLALRSQTWII